MGNPVAKNLKPIRIFKAIKLKKKSDMISMSGNNLKFFQKNLKTKNTIFFQILHEIFY